MGIDEVMVERPKDPLTDSATDRPANRRRLADLFEHKAGKSLL